MVGFFFSVCKEEMTIMAKVSRNDPCPCGSGKKYKKCCGTKERSRRQRSFTQLNQAKMIQQFSSSSDRSPASFLAKHVFKAVSTPVTPHVPSPLKEKQKTERPTASEKSYGSLEELIGEEGAPQDQ